MQAQATPGAGTTLERIAKAMAEAESNLREAMVEPCDMQGLQLALTNFHAAAQRYEETFTREVLRLLEKLPIH